MKKMIEAEKNGQQSPQPKFEIKNDVFTSGNSGAVIESFAVTQAQKLTTLISGFSAPGFLQSIFHPPAAC